MKDGILGVESDPGVLVERTRSVCPRCRGDLIDAALTVRDGQVWLRRWCPRHGPSDSLYEEDASVWQARRDWNLPTGCCSGKTCILVLNVTDRCNFACPTCYASALPPGTPAPAEERPSIAGILRTVRAAIAREGGKLDVLMLSGGEPTVRADLPELLDRVLELPITRVMLNTNGRRLARDDRLLEQLHAARRKVEVYLQFDGLRPSTYLALRGEDVAAEKLATLSRLGQAGVFTTLVMTILRGVNEDEVGNVVRLGLDQPYCAGLALQPAFGSGRSVGLDPLDRVTPTGVLRRLGRQTGGLLAWDDFMPLPCSHPDCCDLAYLVRRGDDTWVSLIKLLGAENIRRWSHLFAGTITFDRLAEPLQELLREGSLERLLSEEPRGATAVCCDVARLCSCVPGAMELLGGFWSRLRRQPTVAEQLAERTFRVTCKMFMDAHTLHEGRIEQCCVRTGERAESFCWHWLFPARASAGGVVPLSALAEPRP